jgi:hypothetical protein
METSKFNLRFPHVLFHIQLTQNLKIAIPHIGLVLLSTFYAIFGAVVFHGLEQPNDMFVKNASLNRVQDKKVHNYTYEYRNPITYNFAGQLVQFIMGNESK